MVGIIDTQGNKVVEYTYDVWGMPRAVTGTLADTIGQKNPIRYRGYYYDTETGFYYLRSRYYDPEIGRFINADGYVSTGQGITGYNMFAYCGNNPINRTDPSGQGWGTVLLVGAAVVVTVVAIIVAVNVPTKEEHYARNDNQKDIPQKPEDIIDSDDWVLQDDSVNRYHRHRTGEQGDKAKDNKKYMTTDKKKEVIINFSDPLNPEIVTDPFNMGTYNFGTNVITHAIKDVLPYWFWGNSPEDSGYVYLWDRILGAD